MSTLWERQEGESNDAFKAFTHFLHMQRPRRIDRYGFFSIAQVQTWYRDFAWPVRATAYDDYAASVHVAEQEEAAKITAAIVQQEQIALITSAHELVKLEMQKWLQQSKEQGGSSLIKAGDLTRMLSEVIKLGRLVRGETTENVTVAKKADLSGFSIEELRMLDELQRKAGLD